VAGDPRRATAELGQAGVDVIVVLTVEAIKRAIARR
jgi:creatinine amidohydrolase/Fe(II)-dependent formamide hydrolase-like protein